MTKEKIIETVNAHVQYNANQGTWSIDNRFADELLTLVNKELLERLEQLHAEMDERMREEVAIEKRMGEKKAEKLLNQIEELTTGKCALRCPLVEQEKKEQVRNILQNLKEYIAYESKPFIKWGSDNSQNEIPDACIDSDMLNNKIDEIAKEYDVEL